MTLLGLSFLLSLQAPAAMPDLCPLVADLNAVIVAETRHTPPPCPAIGFAVLPATGAVRSQAGAYLPDSGRIELAADLDLTTAYGQSYLLHELVHAAQFASGADMTAACPAALEGEAYRVQAAFLLQAGLRRDSVLVGLLAAQLGQCAAEY